jgi:CubicO group peptidase (beta-lactamase class C family)
MVGQAVLTLRNGTAVFQNSGFADRAKQIPVTEQTRFELASVSKHFTAKAVMSLPIDLDSFMGHYVPELTQPVTIHQLLWHTSGLPDYTDGMTWKDGLETSDVIQWLPRQRLISKPGNSYAYMNSNYVILATIVERVTQMSFAEFMRAKFFGPLGMATTQVFQPDIAARGYAQDGSLLEYPNRICGDGGVWTCTADMRHWLGHLDRTSTMFTPGKLNSGTTTGYGYGMNVESECFWHGGFWAGYRNLLWLSRKQQLDIVILTNMQETDVWKIEEAICQTNLSIDPAVST